MSRPAAAPLTGMGIVALVDRDGGQSKWSKIDGGTADQIHPIVLNTIARHARLMTGEATMHRKIGPVRAARHHYSRPLRACVSLARRHTPI